MSVAVIVEPRTGARSAPLPPGLLVSAPASGAGKTTVTLGLLAAWATGGVAVQPFKIGPDYIDAAFHRRAAGRPSFNLDSWAMPAALLDALALRGAGADLIVAEGAMGLFDGAARAGVAGTGASADIAGRMGWPVVLVLDATGQAQSAAATALGFAAHDPAVTVAGVILNRVASPRHERLLRDGLTARGMRVFGALPRCTDLHLPARHLGLVQAEEQDDLDGRLAGLAALMRDHVDLAGLRAAAAGGRGGASGAVRLPPPPGQRIALARDAAFSFVYPHMIDGWHAAGAEILPFSPLADETPDTAADLIWLPGGYPELHAGRLAAAARFHAGLRRAAARGVAIHGECGGYMALGEGLVAADGSRHAMAGLLGLVTSFGARRLHLGYRRATLLAPIGTQPAGTCLTGHEFHYATILDQPDPPLAAVTDVDGAAVTETGSRRATVTGSFFHAVAAV